MTQTPHLTPPTARKQHTETPLHGVTLIDDYAWLRDKQDPEVTAYLEAENAYAESVMSPSPVSVKSSTRKCSLM